MENALKLGVTLKTISSFELSVNDEIWAVPVGTEFTFKALFSYPTFYYTIRENMLRIIDSHGFEHVISVAQFNDHLTINDKET